MVKLLRFKSFHNQSIEQLQWNGFSLISKYSSCSQWTRWECKWENWFPLREIYLRLLDCESKIPGSRFFKFLLNSINNFWRKWFSEKAFLSIVCNWSVFEMANIFNLFKPRRAKESTFLILLLLRINSSKFLSVPMASWGIFSKSLSWSFKLLRWSKCLNALFCIDVTEQISILKSSKLAREEKANSGISINKFIPRSNLTRLGRWAKDSLGMAVSLLSRSKSVFKLINPANVSCVILEMVFLERSSFSNLFKPEKILDGSFLIKLLLRCKIWSEESPWKEWLLTSDIWFDPMSKTRNFLCIAKFFLPTLTIEFSEMSKYSRLWYTVNDDIMLLIWLLFKCNSLSSGFNVMGTTSRWAALHITTNFSSSHSHLAGHNPSTNTEFDDNRIIMIKIFCIILFRMNCIWKSKNKLLITKICILNSKNLKMSCTSAFDHCFFKLEICNANQLNYCKKVE